MSRGRGHLAFSFDDLLDGSITLSSAMSSQPKIAVGSLRQHRHLNHLSEVGCRPRRTNRAGSAGCADKIATSFAQVVVE